EIRARAFCRAQLSPPGERGAHRLPDGRSVGRGERRHVPAGLVAPGPEVIDTLFASRRDGRLELRDVLPVEPEARYPELRADAMPLGRLAQQTREAPHEPACR